MHRHALLRRHAYLAFVVQASEPVIGSLGRAIAPIAVAANKIDHLSDSHAVRLTRAR